MQVMIYNCRVCFAGWACDVTGFDPVRFVS